MTWILCTHVKNDGNVNLIKGTNSLKVKEHNIYF